MIIVIKHLMNKSMLNLKELGRVLSLYLEHPDSPAEYSISSEKN